MPTPNLTATPFAAVPVRILFADDVRELRDVVRLSLTRIGHTVTCAEDGQKAYALFESAPDAFDLIITDHQMPVMTGLELVRALRNRGYEGRIVILCSELNASVEKAYRDLKVDHLVYKPILPSTLRQLVAGLFTPASREAVA